MTVTFDTFTTLEVWQRGIIGSYGNYVNLEEKMMSYNVRRGKGGRFSQFQASTLTVKFHNSDNFFDPTYESVYSGGGGLPSKFGAPIGRWVRLQTKAGRLFAGYITDWNFTYSPEGDSVVILEAMDILGYLATKPLPEIEAPVELTGLRVNRILEASGISSFFVAASEFGLVQMQAETIPSGTLALDYLNVILNTEWGSLVPSGDSLILSTRIKRKRSPSSLFSSDDGILYIGNDTIPFTDLLVSYGTDVLYNRILVQNIDGALVDVSDQDSIDYNGEKLLSLTNLKGELDSDALNLGTYLANEYSVPKLRVDAVSFILQKYPLIKTGPSSWTVADEQYDLVNMDLNNICLVTFAPVGSSTLIEQYSIITSIDVNGVPGEVRLTYGLETFTQYLLLDDTTFGKLDENNVLGQDYRYFILGYDVGGATAELYSRLSAGLILG